MLTLSNRLNACANMVRENSRLCDVGTDHGYVPAFLVINSKIKSAVACDINEGPLSSCRQLVVDLNLSDKIECVLSNGLEKIDPDSVDDVLIAGMGGELIAEILSKCDWANKKHLILNPMTHPEVARKWLYSNGFDIINDIIVNDGKHYYNVFDAEYIGEVCQKNKIDYYLGNIKDFSSKEYFEHLLNYLKNKQKGGEDFAQIISIIEEKL